MSITVTTDVFCDAPGCGDWEYGTVGVKAKAKDARERVREHGWRCDSSGDFCPFHAKGMRQSLDAAPVTA